MCGICGEFRFDGSIPDLARTQKMMTRLERRGPDHGGSYSDGPLVLGHRRLAIIDLSEHANQPLIDQQLGLALVFNGTIYNFPALRSELQSKGYRFFSSGDSEVILKAYAEWGEACVEKLHGMFAFAIWDMRKQRLFLGRDRLGVKPLYYSVNGNRLLFASNAQALLATGDIDTSIDSVGLHHQLTLHAVIPAPHTILNGIKKMRPAHCLCFSADGGLSEREYWVLNATRPAEKMDEVEWTQAIHASLKSAVEKRKTIADVPVGVLLSGGLDSCLLVGLLAEAGVGNIKTFTVGFEDQPEEKGNEFEFSDLIVDKYQTEHHKFFIRNDKVLDYLPDTVDAMAEPMVGQDAVAFYMLSEQVSKEVKVVQSGQGADEVFGGYFWYPQMHEAQGEEDLARFASRYFDRDHEEYLQTVSQPFQGEDHTGQLISKLLAKGNADEYLDKVLKLDVTTLIVDDPVKRVDNMTMAWGLEARVPYLDHELVELAASMPAELKLRSQGKHVLKSIARGIVPDPIIDRPKAYFPVPALKYVRGEFLDFMREILHSEAAQQRGLFQPAYVEKLLAKPESYHTRLQGSKLWHLALLEMWLQRNI
ncbi:Asparagine synthetase [glutamine-hydrolyzing] [hydrothermal vent metagenome]|uniref:Asparagine synthetase [glutamine-hydrolyzing] n=1 Tax=hydrothermal vent metagenome TaxID=652676 RepID=A0A3B0XB02_9ZZZZ